MVQRCLPSVVAEATLQADNRTGANTTAELGNGTMIDLSLACPVNESLAMSLAAATRGVPLNPAGAQSTALSGLSLRMNGTYIAAGEPWPNEQLVGCMRMRFVAGMHVKGTAGGPVSLGSGKCVPHLQPSPHHLLQPHMRCASF